MNRYLQLDFLRGLCLLVMTIDHFGELSLVELFGFISAAEAFVFISGVVSGIVYYRRLKTREFKELQISAFKRGWQIYKYHVICLATLAIVVSLNVPLYQSFYDNRAGLFAENVVLASLLNIFFLYKIYHLDILPMYVVFLFLLPIGLKYADLKTGKYLLTISLVLWIVNLFGATDVFYSWLNLFFEARSGNFQSLGWQFLFFTGFALGILEVKGKLSSLKKNKVLLSGAAMILLLLFVFKRTDAGNNLFPLFQEVLFGKSKIGVVRMLNFMALAFVIAYFMNRYRQWGKSAPLRLLGRHSLYVFTFQTVVLFVAIPFYQELYINGILAEAFESKVVQKGLALVSTIPLSLVIFIPAFFKERRLKKDKAAFAGQDLPEPAR